MIQTWTYCSSCSLLKVQRRKEASRLYRFNHHDQNACSGCESLPSWTHSTSSYVIISTSRSFSCSHPNETGHVSVTAAAAELVWGLWPWGLILPTVPLRQNHRGLLSAAAQWFISCLTASSLIWQGIINRGSTGSALQQWDTRPLGNSSAFYEELSPHKNSNWAADSHTSLVGPRFLPASVYPPICLDYGEAEKLCFVPRLLSCFQVTSFNDSVGCRKDTAALNSRLVDIWF